MMNKVETRNVSIISSYWRVFRMVFVFFGLYLLGYSLYLWDGFRLYGSFSEFLLSMCLASVLITILAIFISSVIWLSWIAVCVLNKIFMRYRNEIKIEHLALPVMLIIVISELVIKLRPVFFPHLSGNYATFAGIFELGLAIVLPIIIVWLIRSKLMIIADSIHGHTTPLVWLFGLFVFISMPVVGYTAWWDKGSELAQIKREELSSRSNKERPNILLVTFDALASRDMSLYGYHRETTPFISEWAKNSSVFTSLKAASDYTSPTTATLMTGKMIWTHQLYRAHGYNIVNAKTENLALLLKNSGYHNIALVQNSLASIETFGITDSFHIAPLPVDFLDPQSLYSFLETNLFKLFSQKFRIYNIFTQQYFIFDYLLLRASRMGTATEYPTEIVFEKFIDLVANKIKEPYFAWIHLFPPHAPFLPPKPYLGMFDSSSKLRSVASQVHGIYFPENIAVTRARYDEFIRYCDNAFEDFIAQLSKRNLLQNTVVVLSADHGEHFGHNALLHGTGHLYEGVTNIPLVIKHPAQYEGRVIRDIVRQIDIAPTILDLANIPLPSWMEGRSIAAYLRGGKLSPEPALSMHIEKTPKGHKIEEGSFAIWEGEYKLIHYLEEDKSLLFNLRDDPDELTNLFNEKQEIGLHLLDLIKINLAKANEKIVGSN